MIRIAPLGNRLLRLHPIDAARLRSVSFVAHVLMIVFGVAPLYFAGRSESKTRNRRGI
jgi:hypothetical protein